MTVRTCCKPLALAGLAAAFGLMGCTKPQPVATDGASPGPMSKGGEMKGGPGGPGGDKGGKGGFMPEKMAAKMAERQAQTAKELGLDEKQKAEYDKLNADYAPKLQALFEDQTLDREAKREQLKKLRDEQTEKLNKILTPDQQKKLVELNERRKAERKGGPGGPKGGPMGGEKGDKGGDDKH